LEALERALLYVEQQSKPTPTDVIFMKRWRDIAASSRRSTLYQKKITDFVKKKKTIYKCVNFCILSISVSINKKISCDFNTSSSD
jgi:menaquinone-dependent protoporphyrinogen IX oxidase